MLELKHLTFLVVDEEGTAHQLIVRKHGETDAVFSFEGSASLLCEAWITINRAVNRQIYKEADKEETLRI